VAQKSLRDVDEKARQAKRLSRPNSAPIPMPMIRLNPSPERPKKGGKKLPEQTTIKPMMKDPFEPKPQFAGKRINYGNKGPMSFFLSDYPHT
jgi:hypothetical protein